MKQIYTLLLLLFVFISQLFASLPDSVLTPIQIQQIINFKYNKDSISYSDFINQYKLKHTDLSVIDTTDFKDVIKLLKPENLAQHKTENNFPICDSLANAIVNSNYYNNFLYTAKENNVKDLVKFKSNIKNYLQNEIFNFYYNNNVISYLDKKEYLELLKPRELVQLLESTKGKEVIQNEIIFIAKNSNYNLYNL